VNVKVVDGRVQVTFGGFNGAVNCYTPPSVPVEQASIVAFNSDIAYFKCAKTRCILYGPGSITDAFSDWEFVREADLTTACQVYEKTILELIAN
jgi:acetylornithine deacetylase/succinyl-diaminopimelate desuccinylase-like protein